jgi:uncharacterized membrane protein YgcG
MIKTTTFFLCLLSFASLTFAFTPPTTPSEGYVVDDAYMFQSEENINTQLLKLKQQTGVEMGIYTLPTIEEETVEGISRAVFDTWEIGNKEIDNGILLVIALQDRKFRLETGYGIEGAIPDLLADRLLDIMAQDFKAQRYDQGVLQVIQEIETIILSDTPYIPTHPDQEPSTLLELLFLLFLPFNWLGGILARSRSWWLGGILGAVCMTLFTIAGVANLWFIIPATAIHLIEDRLHQALVVLEVEALEVVEPAEDGKSLIVTPAWKWLLGL